MGEDQKKQFLELYDTHADAIFRHCFFRVYDREQAKDLVQEVFCRIWMSISEGKEIDNFSAFLYKVANNLIIDHARKKKAVSLDSLMEEGFTLRDDSHIKLKDSIDAKDVIRLVQILDDGYREVIVMRFIDQLSPKEIAIILGVTENVVSVRINRGIKKLRRASANL